MEVDEPKRCLGITTGKTRCRMKSSYSYDVAQCLKQEGCYTCCEIHQHQQIDPADIEAYKRKRQNSFGMKLYQYDEVERINEKRSNKRARVV